MTKIKFNEDNVLNFHVDVADLIVRMVKNMRKTKQGYPSYMTPDEWDKTLKRIQKGFESVPYLLDPETYSDKHVDRFNRGMELFARYYFELWD